MKTLWADDLLSSSIVRDKHKRKKQRKLRRQQKLPESIKGKGKTARDGLEDM